ncbi:hypothetical protein SESBI_35922 [Sesbania bispinosa]|nr:hypothetical protein SESBI_35922 [Sesbania bispinosa]
MRIKSIGIKTMDSYSNSSSLMGSLSSSQKTLTRSPSLEPSTESEQIQSKPSSPKPSTSRPFASKKKSKSVKFINIPVELPTLTPKRTSKRKHYTVNVSVEESKGKEKVDSPKTRSSPRNIPLFLNKEVENFFNTKFKERKVLLGKLIDMKSLRKSKWDLSPYLQKQKMGNLFEENVKVYPSLTRAFYAAASIQKTGNRTPTICSWLTGKEMIIDRELVCKLIGMTSQGIYLYNEREWMEIVDVSKEEVGKALFIIEKMSSEVFEHFDVPLSGEEISDESRKYLSAKSLCAMKISGKAQPLSQSILPTPSSSPTNPSPIPPSSPGEQGASQGRNLGGQEQTPEDPNTRVVQVLSKLKGLSDKASPEEEVPTHEAEAISPDHISPAHASDVSQKSSINMNHTTFATSLLTSPIFEKSIPVGSSSQSELPKGPSRSIVVVPRPDDSPSSSNSSPTAKTGIPSAASKKGE